MAARVKSSRFLSRFEKRLVRAWIDREPVRDIPWTPLGKPLSQSTIALVSSAGLALASDPPFDQDGERRNPWWGDPGCRFLPRTAETRDVRMYHLHVDTKGAEKDLDCVLPLHRLLELEAGGVIGRSAPTHYSFMGYLLDPAEFLRSSVPAMIARMKSEGVDGALLVPV